jgi:ketopantoate hydroxymethyltransferase
LTGAGQVLIVRDMNATAAETLVFDHRKNTAHVHRTGCSAIRKTATTVTITEGVAEEIADLTERGFKVVRCKCTK